MNLLDLENIKKSFKEELNKVSSVLDLGKLQQDYLGKKGKLAEIFENFSKLPPQEKKSLGLEFNKLKKEIEEKLAETENHLSGQINEKKIDDFLKTLSGKKPAIGHLHIITQAIREITEIFKPLGFRRVRYPEVEWEYFAFEALNMPATHPARDEWETFFVEAPEDKEYGRMLLTPHTSSGQVREMLKGELPIRMLNISRCDRRQIDINHIPTFFQFEGLVVDKGISIAHLKGVLDYFVKNFFGPERKFRLRPFNFKFTEPSFEIDIDCNLCQKKGCRFCKEGWVELGGAGLVHPNVLKYGKIDSKIYSVLAFGWGVERTYMMKSGTEIDDIRYLFENDLRFLEQF